MGPLPRPASVQRGAGLEDAGARAGGTVQYSTIQYSTVQYSTVQYTYTTQEGGDTHRARLVLAWLCQHTGTEDPRTWLEAAALETRAGKPLEAAQLLARAEARLKPELREKFAVLRDNAGL